MTSKINSAIEDELKSLSFSIEMTERKLKEFEEKHNQSSGDFYKTFHEGKAGDDEEIMEWAGEYETLIRLKDDYRRLREIEVCRT